MTTGHRQPVTLDVWTPFGAPTPVRTVVERRRLLDTLRAGRPRLLVVVRAPAGYGKTTLAGQWRQILLDEGAVVAWLGLRRDDDDPRWFLAHLLEVVRHALPSADREIRDLAQLIEQSAEDTQSATLAVLLDRIATHDGRFVLIVDDWHLVDDPSVHRALARLLDLAPPNLSIVLTSRAPAQLQLSRLRVRRQLTEVDADGLRFDLDETRALLLDRTGLPLDLDDVTRLWEGTDGRVAALTLAALSLRAGADPAELVRDGHHGDVEHLVENVLDRLPVETVDFLLATSVGDRVCGELACVLSGRTDGQEMLEDLERRDLFLGPLDGERVWFRYHHLVADHLRRRLEREQPGRADELHTRASTWFAGQDLVTEAVTHALAVCDVGGATDLVEQHAMPLVEHRRMISLFGLVGRLPAGAADARPRLSMAVAWANCLLRLPAAAQLALDHVRRALPVGDEHDEVCVEADVAQACVDVLGDRTDRAEQLVRRILERPAGHRPWVVAVAADVQTFCDIHAIRLRAARDRQVWARPFRDRRIGAVAEVYGRCLAGVAALAQLDLPAAEEQFQGAAALARESAGRRSPAARLAGALLGELHYERGELAEAERLLEEGGELGAESGIVDFMVVGFVVLARIRAMRGATTEAVELLAEGAGVATRLGLTRLQATVVAERIALLLTARRVREARRVTRELPDGGACHGGIGVAIDQVRTRALAAVLSAEGDHHAAAGLLDELVADLARRGQLLAHVRATVQLAAVHERAARRWAAERTLASVLAAAAAAGLRQALLDGGPPVTAVLVRLLARARADTWPDGCDPVRADLLAPLVPTAPQAGRAAELNGRESDILRMLDSGCTNQQIARSMTVTVNTVKWYLKNIYIKLGAANRTEAVSMARRAGLLQ